MVGGCDRDGRTVKQGHHVAFLLFEPLNGVANRLGIRRMLLETAVGGHEVPKLAIVVQILHVGIHHVSAFQAFA